MAENIVIANTKGGVGKSSISSMILPTFLNGDVNLYQVDDNNVHKIENCSFNIINMKTNEAEEMTADIDFSNISEESITNIIDCGGGNDTIKILSELKGIKNIKYLVPINDDIDQINNALDTIKLIKANEKKPNITLVLSRVINLSEKETQEQFVGLYGSEELGVEPRIKEFTNCKLTFVPNTPILGVLKNIYSVSLKDSYLLAKESLSKIDDLKAEWVKLGREEYKKEYKKISFWNAIVNFVESDLEHFKKSI